MSGALSKRTVGSLSKYNPEAGLKKVAVFEAAEKHYARAKDATKLQQAIRAKLEAQADFLYWWKTREKNKGGRPLKTGDRSVVGFRERDEELAQRLGTTLRQIQRWMKKLDDPESFEHAYQTAIARYPKILEFESMAHVGQNSGENEWYTPKEYIEAARAVLGTIELDPATTDTANAVVKAEQIYTLEDPALEQTWHGRVWLNPPYAQPLITQFCEKFAASVRAGTVPEAVVLVNNATETQWFVTIWDVSSAICFPTGRIRFWSPSKVTATPLQGQALLYVGKEPAAFCREFGHFGRATEISR